MTRSFSKAALSLAMALAAGCFIRVDIYTDAGAGSASGTGGAGGSGGACTPGETRPCYDGPEGTEGKGICKAGVQTCFPDGSSWFSCSGAVKPAAENCATPEDEDCDGEAPSCQGDILWAERFGDSHAQEGRAIAVDSDGNVVVAGIISGEVDFGSGTIQVPGAQQNAFVAKFDTNGSLQWSKSFGDAGAQFGTGVAVDGLNNILVVGYFSGEVDLGGGPLQSPLGYDIFLAKFDVNGAHLWSKQFGGGGADSDYQYGFAIAADASGNSIITGYFSGGVDFGGGFIEATSGSDIFLAKLDPSGNYLWGKGFGNGKGQSVKTDIAGDVFVAGVISGSADFGGGTMLDAGNGDAFVAKLDASGNHLWSKRFGDVNSQSANAVAVDQFGDVFVVGSISGSVDFGGGPLSGPGQNAFIAKFDTDGAYMWSGRYGGNVEPSGQGVKDVAVDVMGNVSIVGSFFGPVDFGGGSFQTAGAVDIFLAKFDGAGGHLWSKHFGDISNDYGQGVAVNSAGNVFITGYIEGTVNFGNGVLQGAGGSDIFVAKFAP